MVHRTLLRPVRWSGRERASLSHRRKEVAILTSSDNREQLLSTNLFIAMRRSTGGVVGADRALRFRSATVDHGSKDREQQYFSCETQFRKSTYSIFCSLALSERLAKIRDTYLK